MLSLLLLPAPLLLPLPPQAPPLPAEVFQRFQVDPAGSEVGFDGTSTLHDFTGRTRQVGGELRVDPGALATTAGGEVWADAASLDTGSEGRDENMREKLEVERFPRIVFHLDGLQGRLEGWQGHLTAIGRFEIHGVARSRTFPVTVAPDGAGGLRVKGELRFRMTDHGIEPPVVAVITVDDEVRVWFDVRLVPVAGEAVEVRAWRVAANRQVQASGAEARKEAPELESLYEAADGVLLWMRPAAGELLRLGPGEAVPRRLLLASGTAAPLPPPCDDAFHESRERLASLEAKLAKLPEARRARLQERMAGTLARLREATALAPAAGAAQVLREGNRTVLRLGGTDWVVLEGLEGEAPFPALLLGLDGLPAAVRKELPGLRGMPKTVTVRGVNPAGAWTLRLEVAAAGSARLASWALETDWWRAEHP